MPIKIDGLMTLLIGKGKGKGLDTCYSAIKIDALVSCVFSRLLCAAET